MVFLGNIVEIKDGFHGTSRDACPTIYTNIRINIKLWSGIEGLLSVQIRGGMYAINRTNLNTTLILDSDTPLRYYVSHT
jgi:hypothetical protein